MYVSDLVWVGSGSGSRCLVDLIFTLENMSSLLGLSFHHVHMSICVMVTIMMVVVAKTQILLEVLVIGVIHTYKKYSPSCLSGDW